MSPTFAILEQVTDRKYHAVHVRDRAISVTSFTHASLGVVDKWIADENLGRATRLAQMNEKIRNDDLSDYPRIADLVGQAREDEKERLIEWNNDTMSPLGFVIVEETLTFKPVKNYLLDK